MSKQETYIELYNLMSCFIEAYNPCNIQKQPNGTVTCVNYPEGNNENVLCCGPYPEDIGSPFEKKCKHLCKTGCKTKSLSCKMWLCQKAYENLYENNTKESFIDFLEARDYILQILKLNKILLASRASMAEVMKNKTI